MTAPSELSCYRAWDLVGFDPDDYDGARGVRIVGGRTVYDAVGFDDETPGDNVRLSRVAVHDLELRAVVRYVDPDILMEVVR